MSISDETRSNAYATLYALLKGRESEVISSEHFVQGIKKQRKDLEAENNARKTSRSNKEDRKQ